LRVYRAVKVSSDIGAGDDFSLRSGNDYCPELMPVAESALFKTNTVTGNDWMPLATAWEREW
jgi:hypothetical protein